jgi:hypothetical protein
MFRTKPIKLSAVVSVAMLMIECIVSFGGVQMVYLAAGVGFTVPCAIDTYGNAWKGNLTFILRQYDPSGGVFASYLVVMNTSGELLYLREYNGGFLSGVTKYVSNDTLMFQAGGSTQFLNFDTGQTTDFPNVNGYHHDIEYDPATGNFLVLRNYVRNVNGTDVLYDTIDELNAAGSVLWTWDTYDHLPLSWADPYNLTTTINGEIVEDFSHCNAIQWDYDENVVYLNSRHLDTFFKIDMTSGDIIWDCGLHGNFTLLDANGNKVPSLWYHSHDTEEIAPDVFMMFDNDYHNQTDINDANSRILELTLDEQNMTAKEIWSWEAPEEYWSYYWGEADVLPNGDRIGTFGTETKPYNSSIGAVIAEVSPQGDLVRTWTFPTDWGIYRVVPGQLVPTSLGIYPEISQKGFVGEYNPAQAIFAMIIAALMIPVLLYGRRRKRARSA